MVKPSTFSIVAYDKATNSFGVAVASKFLAVGSVVPWLSSVAGAVATQSYCNTDFGSKGLPLLAQGVSAEETFKRVAASDPGLQTRQVGLVDRSGGSFTFTGSECNSWAGGISGNGYAIQGNILVSEGVIQAMESAFLSTNGDFEDRLFAALKAGDDAGGDKRGRQSAALKIVKDGAGYGGNNDIFVDLRVDNDPDPIPALAKMIELRKLYFPSAIPSPKVAIDAELIDHMTPALVRRNLLDPNNKDLFSFTSAFETFIGIENFEDRYDFMNHLLDKPVYDYILKNY